MQIKNTEQLERLYNKLKNELGIFISRALEDYDILEVVVTSKSNIFLDSMRTGYQNSGQTLAPSKLEAALGTIAAMNDLEINTENPSLSCVLPLDGSRVQGTIPPLTPSGPAINIRKHSSSVYPLSQYVAEGRIQPEHAEYLKEAIRKRKNIIIAGGTSSGKTTFGNAVIQEIIDISPQDRLLVMEDTMELKIGTDNAERLVTCKNVNMQNILKIVMRERPDRIIIGEVRDGAALDLLKSWNTGHSGGFATVHADSARETMIRMEQMILEAVPNRMRELIGSAVDVIIYMTNLGRLGGRSVVEIVEVEGVDETGGYRFKDIYRHAGLDD